MAKPGVKMSIGMRPKAVDMQAPTVPVGGRIKAVAMQAPTPPANKRPGNMVTKAIVIKALPAAARNHRGHFVKPFPKTDPKAY